MKTFGEQAIEKLYEVFGCGNLDEDEQRTAMAQIIDTLHAQQPPCDGCEGLKEALEKIDAQKPIMNKGQGCNDPYCWPCSMWKIAHEALAQPCQQPASHPEDYCQKCGRPNCTWFVESKLWNKVVRANNEPEILCPICFVQLAEASGIKPTSWELRPEQPASVGSGEMEQVRQALRCLRLEVDSSIVNDIEAKVEWAFAAFRRQSAPVEIHPDTLDLVRRFSQALLEKLAAAEKKYGWTNGWKECGLNWGEEVMQERLLEHLAKGDPRDVAAYCAFLWHHGLSTKAAPVEITPKCETCDWTNVGCLNVGDPGKPKWICTACIKRALDALVEAWRDLEKTEVRGQFALDGDRLVKIGERFVWQRRVTQGEQP